MKQVLVLLATVRYPGQPHAPHPSADGDGGQWNTVFTQLPTQTPWPNLRTSSGIYSISSLQDKLNIYILIHVQGKY